MKDPLDHLYKRYEKVYISLSNRLFDIDKQIAKDPSNRASLLMKRQGLLGGYQTVDDIIREIKKLKGKSKK